ncbi:MAG: TldD/PmbA family protein [Actinomycetia bacterium]|nr:TldD/PmbA family protein [Actinomycetes bacterium]
MSSLASAAAELARRAVSTVAADEAEAVVSAEDSALTRFANNHIHQNVAETGVSVSIRAVVGTRQGVASTNRTDDEGLRACAEAAARAATVAPEDPEFRGLPAPMPVELRDRAFESTRRFDAEARARAAAAIIAQSTERGLTAAGTVSRTEYAVAVANSHGIDVSEAVTSVKSTVLAMGVDGGSGWASWLGGDADAFAPEALGDQAATLAQRSEGPGALDAGVYPVVLAPDAVSDLMDFLGYTSFGAKDVYEHSSFVADHQGQQVFSELFSLTDDALAEETLGLTFDFEGMPKRRVPLVDKGVVLGPVTDSYWAARLGLPNTGHALPAPNPYGPLPLNLEVAPGDATIDEMIKGLKRGLYVTRFHYMNVEDPLKVTLTGMTRDGTFLIEDGRLTRPVKNVRFTQSLVEALGSVRAVGNARALIGPDEGGATLVPALLLERWEFTGQTR